MLFVTEQFLLFFIVVFLVFWALPVRWRLEFLLVASIFFYATWSVVFALHFLLVIAVNFVVMEIWKLHRKKWIFFTLQILNILNIGFFKYFYFLADVIGRLSGQDWLRQPWLFETHAATGAEIALPLGISFYTFQIMAYGIDIYRGSYARAHSFRDVTLFLTFFPQLIAGPIMRAQELLPQIGEYRTKDNPPDPDMFWRGLWLVLLGVVKKLLVADRLLEYCIPVLSAGPQSVAQFHTASLWFSIVSMSMMLYCDFSAYSDIARGLGFLLGFEIPINFRAPFLSDSVSEFWRRWHLTFSTWIRDYIYIPLGGSRAGTVRNYLNLGITFFIGGLWHGASYTFAFWGIYMGVILSIEAFVRRNGAPPWAALWPVRILRWMLATFLISLSAVWFFSPSWEWSMSLLSVLFLGGGTKWPPGGEIFFVSVAAVALFHWFEEKPGTFAQLRRFESVLLPLIAFVMIILIVQYSGGPKDFFYFQF